MSGPCINGRYGIDALPAGFQTYFNPTVYFPVYYLRHSAAARPTA